MTTTKHHTRNAFPAKRPLPRGLYNIAVTLVAERWCSSPFLRNLNVRWVCPPKTSRGYSRVVSPPRVTYHADRTIWRDRILWRQVPGYRFGKLGFLVSIHILCQKLLRNYFLSQGTHTTPIVHYCDIFGHQTGSLFAALRNLYVSAVYGCVVEPQVAGFGRSKVR
ncbi:hypothetical protein M427DRAFT_291187 [Gonapodya prolifera JEL478]|uniref:Uncharacterized protein n=1 Tax=Gonapodya prolifera (strain JEL478) TaxID=1344416 RepID=A0A139AJ45_GONPJ|nr:hypothetical protein M427DRAFT_291187 [Gonapodya prolifera JEL478]|eukprot:KXS16483.1 hypothetical protein M427DRAFT_291187 [Gonapodya prolifera JEL478]